MQGSASARAGHCSLGWSPPGAQHTLRPGCNAVAAPVLLCDHPDHTKSGTTAVAAHHQQGRALQPGKQSSAPRQVAFIPRGMGLAGGHPLEASPG